MSAKFTGSLVLDRNSISDEQISSSTVLDADKLQHVYKPGTAFGFAIGATPTTREEIVYVATQAGTVRGFHGLLDDTGSSTSVTYDLKKNGTTMLSSVATVTHATSDRAVVDGTLSVTSFAADDVISIAMTVSSSTGAKGPFSWADIEENAAP